MRTFSSFALAVLLTISTAAQNNGLYDEVIFPNPVDKGSVAVRVSADMQSVVIRNLTGELMFETKKMPKGGADLVIELDERRYIDGVYFVTAFDGSSAIWTRRLVVTAR